MWHSCRMNIQSVFFAVFKIASFASRISGNYYIILYFLLFNFIIRPQVTLFLHT